MDEEQIKKILETEGVDYTDRNFCKKGHMITPKSIEKYPEIKTHYCKTCDKYYMKQGKPDIIITPQRSGIEGVAIIDEKDSMGREISGYSCGKCGFKQGFVTTMQLDHSDEPEVNIYKCGRCGTVSRDGG